MTMKDTSCFYCNLDSILIPVNITDLREILKKGVKVEQIVNEKRDTLLPIKCEGVYGVSTFRQWKNKAMSEIYIGCASPDHEVVLRIDKSVVLYMPFHFNKAEAFGQRELGNTLESDESLGESVWKYNVVANLTNLHMNEIIFNKTINPSFIKEIWYFTECGVPSGLYDFHCKVPLIANPTFVLL
jgi:hypothetical protein